MSTSPYTWNQWRERFMAACRGLRYHAAIDFDAEPREYWEGGEDPQSTAEAYINEMSEGHRQVGGRT